MLRINNFLSQNYNLFLGLLGAVLVFRKPGTIGLIVVIAISVICYRNINLNTKKIKLIALVALPLLLDILFFWNNEAFLDGFKHLEKRVSLLLLPLIIVGFFKKIQLLKILKVYTLFFILILDFLLIKFLWSEPVLVQKYLKGIHLWEMGYKFANSTTVHAPALNMHVAFAAAAVTFILTSLRKGIPKIHIAIWLVLLINILGLLLLINTRLAMVLGVFGVFLVLVCQLLGRVSLKRLGLITGSAAVVMLVMFLAFAKAFPYVYEKFSKVTFAHMDKVNQLDDFENPEGEVFNSFVTRVSIWNTALDRAKDDLWLGVGAADGKDELNQAYIDTGQQFLARWKFPTHNQYIDFLLKFGVLGLVGTIIFMLNIAYMGFELKNSLILFFFILFAASNLTDDFLIRYDGITFSALWISIFSNLFYYSRRGNDLPST